MTTDRRDTDTTRPPAEAHEPTGGATPGTTPAERNQRIIALHHAGHEVHDIAKLIGRSINTVYRVLRRAEVQLARKHDKVEADGEAIAKAYAEGGTLKGVGRQFGVSRNVVERRVLRHGGKVRSAARPVRIAEVVRLYRSGANRAKIARLLGREWQIISRTLKEGGIEPRNGNYGGFAEHTITWHACSRQNRIKTRRGWQALGTMVWERTHGPVAPGCVISHIDRSLTRSDIDKLANLVMMKRRTQPARLWAARNVPIPDNPIDRRETLITILTIAAAKAGDTTFKLGTW